MSGNGQKKGLGRKLHSALEIDNVNLLKFQGRHGGNPYLQEQQLQGPAPKARVSKHWYRPGEVVEYAEELRKQNQERIDEEHQIQVLEQKAQAERSLKIEAGELPASDEECYFTNPEEVPHLEWWDEPYFKEGEIHPKYSQDYSTMDPDDYSDDEEEEEPASAYPSIRYIQHPVPIERPQQAVPVARIFLTKKEQRKARRNTRKLVRQEKEEKIKLGLEPKPVPKVKLSNMMSVYENDANIADPTEWESIVRRQVAERKRKHLEENEKRHQESLKRRKEGNGAASEKFEAPQYTCAVYTFDQIKDPAVRFKVKTNGKQFNLKGCCLHINNERGIIICFGSEKSIRLFDRLVTKRIDWSKPFVDKDSKMTVKWNGNLRKVWHGSLSECRFRGWFMLNCTDAMQLNSVLDQHDAKMFVPSGEF